MNQKQKINLASLIVTRCNIHLLRRIFLEELPDGEQAFSDFWTAEQEGYGEQYLCEQATFFPPERRKMLADYYKIRGIIEMKMVHRGEKIFSAMPSHIQEYLNVQNQGVLDEYDYLKSVFEHSGQIHRNTILATIAEEIELYQQYADLIIGLHPNWHKDEAFADFAKANAFVSDSDQQTTDEDETDLAFSILRRIAPDEHGNWLPITNQEHSRLMEALQKEVSFLLRTDDGLSEEEKRRLTNNNQALLQYLDSVDEPANAAFTALIYQTINPENRRTPEFMHGIWKLGVQYARLEGLTPEDYEAIRRLFLYCTRAWEKYREKLLRMMGASANSLIVKAWMELGQSNAALSEWQAAIDCYMKVAALRFEDGEYAKAGKALFDAVDSLQTAGLKKDALALSARLLQPAGKMPAEFGLPAGFELDAEAREAIEVNLVNLMDGVGLTDRTIRDYASLLQTDAARALYQLHVGLDKDVVFLEDMQQAQKALTDFYGRQHAGDDHSAYNRAVDILLNLLNDYRDADEFEARLQEIQPFESELPGALSLLYQLNLAKLAYLRDDPACLDAFAGLLPQMDNYPDSFDESRRSQWLTSAVRAWHLSLPGRPDRLDELEALALRALNFVLQGYVVRFRDRSALNALMNESEELIKALLLNEAFVQKDLVSSQRLLRMVWNILMLRKDFLNRYLSKSGLEIIQESRYLEQLAAFRQELFAYIANPTPQQADALQGKVWDFRSNESPYWHERAALKKWEDPREPSLAFHFFTKTDEGRMLLMLSFQPQGHAVPEERFLHVTREVPASLEVFLEGGTPVYGESVGNAHRYIAGFSEEDTSKGKAGQIFGPDWEVAFNRLFADFLQGGEAFYRISNWQRDIFEERPVPTTPRLHLYCDHFLQLMPLEKLYTDPEQPLGLHSNFSIVLRQAHAPTPIDFGYPVVLVSGVPGQLRVPALPFADEEAVAIEQMLRQNGIRVQHLQGSKATRENLDSALTEYPAIVHFATHGLADPELPPETSALLLTADGNDAASCLLTYQDILMMDWSSVKLVVLSACNSSVGKVRKGSPMQGLAYAFLSKGVQYVVASRSPVSDRSSKIIMTKFYEYLQSTDPVEAMRLTRAWFHHQPGQVSELDVMAWGVWT